MKSSLLNMTCVALLGQMKMVFENEAEANRKTMVDEHKPYTSQDFAPPHDLRCSKAPNEPWCQSGRCDRRRFSS